MRFKNPPRPDTGNNPKVIENSRISTGPSAKFGRNGNPKKADEAHCPIGRASTADRADDSKRYSENQRKDRGSHGELDRGRIACDYRRSDRLLISKRHAKIATKQPHHVRPILLQDRPVQPELVAQPLDL
jgi:hypothetical protein